MIKIIKQKRGMKTETIEKSEGRMWKNRMNRNFCKIFCLLLILSTVSTVAFANPVDLQKAQQVGQSFLKAKPKMQRSNKTLHFNLVKTEKATINRTPSSGSILRSAVSEETPVFYVFNNEGGGFVIVSGDDRVKPILGYSETNSFDANNIPPNAAAWLEGYKEQIRYAIENNVTAAKEIQAEWNDLATGNNNAPSSTQAVGPLLQTTWNQWAPYNDDCPTKTINDPNDYWYKGHTPTGCVATAMAQIMKYWNYPTTGAGYHSYTPATNPEYGTLSADFGSTTYDWANMLNNYPDPSSGTDAQRKAVAMLMYHCGVALNMDYTDNGSGAFLNDVMIVLPTFFGYDYSINYLENTNVTIDDWQNLLRTELDANRPILYSVADLYHAFVCDGYDNDNLFHFNWGWSGSNDGWYLISLLSSSGFNPYNHEIVYNIKPCEGALSWEIGDPTPANVIATLNNGTLTISGAGATQNWSGTNPFARKFFSNVIINDGVTSIGDNTFGFGDSKYLNSVSIGNSVTSIGNMAFWACDGLSSLLIPNGVISIGNAAFNGCNSLSSLLIPNSVTSIGSDFVLNCNSLTSIDVESGNNTYASEGGVLFNKAKTTLIQYPWGKTDTLYIIPNSVTDIGESAILSCNNLTSIIIPNSVINVGNSAFWSCKNLNLITIANSVTSIGISAFSNCTSLTDVTVNWTKPLSIPSTTFSGVNLSSVNLHVPAGTENAYKSADVWKNFNVIGDNKTGISNVETDKINIYPNPIQSELFIKSELPISKVEIYSLSSALLISENNFTGKISLSSLLNGTYIVKVYTEKGLTVSKVLKE